MARAQWALRKGRPVVHVELHSPLGAALPRILLADTGAGSATAPFELLLDEHDCVLCGGKPTSMTFVSGAYFGSFPLYMVRIRIPILGFDDDVPALGVPMPPKHLDGIAAFCFLNRFSYGNFGNTGEFGLET